MLYFAKNIKFAPNFNVSRLDVKINLLERERERERERETVKHIIKLRAHICAN